MTRDFTADVSLTITPDHPQPSPLSDQLADITRLAEARRQAVPGSATWACGDVTGSLLAFLQGYLGGFPADAWAAAVAHVEECTEVSARSHLDAQMAAACEMERAS